MNSFLNMNPVLPMGLLMMLFSPVLLAAQPPAQAAPAQQSALDESAIIANAITQFVQRQLVLENNAFEDIHVSITLGENERNLPYLPRTCDESIQVVAPRPDKGWLSLKGTRRFMVSCANEPAVVIAAEVLLMQHQWVANRVVERGSILTEDHVSRVLKPIGLNRLSPQQVVGQSVSRRIRQGQVIQFSQLQAPVVISRGQKIRLLAKDGIVQSILDGEAVTEGAIGETIRVRNSKSRIIVEGIIRDNQTVEVLL